VLGDGGPIGPADSPPALTPIDVVGGFAFTEVSVGFTNACGHTTTDGVVCWGGNNQGGLGDGTTIARSTPATVAGTWAQVHAGRDFACALDPAGAAYCWGDNDAGNLGIGVTPYFETPTAVP
jgi:alpha-tubulin suppressor-like RCC1 family protein